MLPALALLGLLAFAGAAEDASTEKRALIVAQKVRRGALDQSGGSDLIGD